MRKIFFQTPRYCRGTLHGINNFIQHIIIISSISFDVKISAAKWAKLLHGFNGLFTFRASISRKAVASILSLTLSQGASRSPARY